MSKRHRKKKARPIDPEDVISGRVRTDLEGLFRLIHRVNPTGRDLPKDRKALLYRQKSALQSLLIRQHGDHLRVSPGDHESVVSLDHRLGQHDACHAVLADLEADAASWVRRQLDLASLPETGLPAPQVSRPAAKRPSRSRPAATDSATVSELRERGLAAIEEYDYEAAEQWLTRAFERGGGLSAALPLVELLVDVLGDDETALGLAPRLSVDSRSDSRIRSFLALAAARQDDEQEAVAFMSGGIEDHDRADVHAALAAHAVRRQDLEAAHGHVDAVRAAITGHPEIPALEHELQRLAAERRRPEEARLLELFEREGALAIEEEAREFLSRWPDNEVARRIVREASAIHRREKIETSLAAGDRAAGEGRDEEAAGFYQQAVDAGCDRQDLPALITELRQRHRARDEARRVEETLAAFSRSETGSERPERRTSALLSYLSLPPNLRTRVLEHASRDEHALASPCRWLELIEPPSVGGKAHAAIRAVLDLARALRALEQGDAQAALDLLDPHERELRHVTDAQACLAAATAALAEATQKAMRSRVDRAATALLAGHLEQAQECLADITPTALAAADRPAFDSLTSDLRRAERLARLTREYQGHSQAGDLLGARERAQKLTAITADAEREDWEQRSDQLRCQIQELWQVEVESTCEHLADIVGFTAHPSETPEFWLAEDGRSLFIAEAMERWLLIWQVDLQADSVRLRISLRTPEPLGAIISFYVTEESFSVIGEGYFLELGRDDWSIVRWRSFGELVPESAIIDSAFLVPGSPWLWVSVRERKTNTAETHIVDVESWRTNRRQGRGYFAPFLERSRPGAFSYHGQSKIYSSSGVLATDFELPPFWEVYAMTAGATERYLWLTVVRLDLSQDAEETRVEVVEFDRQGKDQARFRRLLRLEAIEDAGLAMATDTEVGVGFVLYRSHENRARLAAFTGERSAALYDVSVPVDTVLVQDCRARRVGLVATGVPLALTLLGRRPPAIDPPDDDACSRRSHVALHSPFLSGPPHPEANAVVLAMIASFTSISAEQIALKIEKMARKGRPLDLACLALQRLHPERSAWQPLVQKLARQESEDVGLALIAAGADAEDEDWPSVHAWLADKNPEPLDPGRRLDFHHLLGVALLTKGKPLEATREFEAGMELEDGDRLVPLRDLAESLTIPARVDPTDSAIRRLVSSIRIGDEALQVGDLEAAKAALDQPVVWRAVEVQSAARLAELYLRDEAASVFHRRRALAHFLHAYVPGEFFYQNLPLPGLAWQRERLDERAERARAWLDASAMR